MKFTATPLKGCFAIELSPFTDERGWFARTYCKNEFAAIGHTKEWVQMNHSFTQNAGTVRGMHFQRPPYTEVKMVRCIAGAVWDIVVDLRKNSATYLKHFSVELSAANKKMIYIPEGFAHGFQALVNDTELIYHHSQFYTPGSEDGIRYDDIRLGIEWPLPVASVSQRDLSYPDISENFDPVNIELI